MASRIWAYVIEMRAADYHVERTPFLVAGIFWLMVDLTVSFFLCACDMCASLGIYIIEGATSTRAAKKNSKKKSKYQPSSDLFLK